MKRNPEGWKRVLNILLPYFFIVGTFDLIGAKIFGIELIEMNAHKTSEELFILKFFSLLGTFFVVWLFMKFMDKENFVQLGFQTKNRLPEFYFGIGIGALVMSTGYLLLLFLDEIVFRSISFDGKEMVISIFLFIMVAIMEEVLFRGYILKNLMLSFNKYVALILSSILFSLIHGWNPNIDLLAFANLFLAGIVLGMSYIYTKNLWFPIAQHLSWNLFQSSFGFNVSGLNSYSIIEFSIPKNNLINGGAFGFEGSILAIIAQLILITTIWYYYNQETFILKKAAI